MASRIEREPDDECAEREQGAAQTAEMSMPDGRVPGDVQVDAVLLRRSSPVHAAQQPDELVRGLRVG